MDVPLRLSAEDMRSLGYRAVDLVIDHLATLPERPVGGPPDRAALESQFGAEFADHPSDAIEVLERAVRQVRESIVHTDHPRFLAYIPGPGNYVGAVADFIAAGLNVFAGQWLVGAGPAVIERVTVDWLRRMCGLPGTAGGLFVSGGTMATLVAIHAARTAAGPGMVVYVSTQTHHSVRKGLRFLGFSDSQVRVIEVDSGHRMNVAMLAGQVRRDGRPGCVVATAGTTSTGAVDPLDALADLCAGHDLWLHVDGAYGAAAVLSDRARPLLTGLERADSVALDPHKWWYQPYEIGCVLVRDQASLMAAFGMNAEYLRETRHGTGPLNYYDLGPQLTREFRALKLWMSVRTFGVSAFRHAIDHSITLAEHAGQVLERRDRWEIVTPAQLAIVTFRPRWPGADPAAVDALTREIATATLRDGYALVTTTEIGGHPVLRLCTTHPQTTHADIEQTILLLERLAAGIVNDTAATPRPS
jgi:aromatic-L-amino-acid/L-tryptophan decarboxylase